MINYVRHTYVVYLYPDDDNYVIETGRLNKKFVIAKQEGVLLKNLKTYVRTLVSSEC